MKTKIFGASDDLVEIKGEINDEQGCYESAKTFVTILCSDGTKGKIRFSKEGLWKITIIHGGHLIQSLHSTTGEEHIHTGLAKGCISYSDVLILDEGIEWIKIGRAKFKKQ